MKIEGRPARFLAALAYRVVRLWARTLRFQLDDRASFLAKPPEERVIGALWHNRLLLLPHIAALYAPARQPVALISASRDGDFLAEIVQRFGVKTARGSSSRKGAGAILQLADMIAAGYDVAITPDGPRGPAYQLGPGIVFLAQQSGAPILLMNMEYSSCWRLKSWDGFILPKPFSRVRVIFGGPCEVRKTASNEEFESERLRLQNAMMEIVERR